LKGLYDYINTKVLVKVARLNGATLLTKLVAGFLTTKFIAVLIGAEGLALIGNLQNFFNSMQSLATAGMYNGLVKYIGEYKNKALNLSRTLSTSYYIGFVTTILVCLLSYYNAEVINDFLFSPRYNFAYVIKIMALALPFYALNVFSFSIMNGFTKYKFLMIINIIGQTMGLGVTLLLIWQNNIDGALIAVVIAPSLIFLITLVGILNRRSMIPSIKVSNIDIKWIRKLGPYSIMALVSGLALPLVFILVRTYIIDHEGMKDAGFWEAMNRISSYYLMIVYSLMTFYFLPRFTEIDNPLQFRNELSLYYKKIIPFISIGLLLIFILRPLVVSIFLTDEFELVEELFGWQLLGDFVKILSMVLVYWFLAKRKVAHFVISELILAALLYFSSIYFIDRFGVHGAPMAHFVTYMLYFGLILLIFRSSIFGTVKGPDHK
jgi:PST family polysaccharide transporter